MKRKAKKKGRNKVKNYFSIIATILILFQVGYASAEKQQLDSTQKSTGKPVLNLKEGYKSQSIFMGYLKSEGKDPDLTPSAIDTQFNFVNSASTNFVVSLAGPSIFTTEDALVGILRDPDISPASKLGVYGMVEYGNRYLLDNQPYVDVPEHLAQSWVPGYDSERYNSFAYGVVYNACDRIEDPELKERCNSECPVSQMRGADRQIECARGIDPEAFDGIGGIQSVANGWDYLNKMGITPLWGRMLMIAYVLFVIVMIVAGFMIMFRNKIGGQVAVTIYNTIPNIVIALLLATFSFAIVGMIINASVFLSTLVRGILGVGEDYKYVTNLIDLAPEGVTTNKETAEQFIREFGLGKLVVVANLILSINPANISQHASDTPSPGTMLILAPILIITIFISIRVFFTLIKAFLGILVDTIFGPVILTFSAIPGLDKLRKQWFSRLIKNALVFPFVLALINIPAYVTNLTDMDKMVLDMELLSAGDFSKGISSGSGFVASVFMAVFPFVCYNAAANVPHLLEDFFPSQVGQGMAKFMAGAQQPLGKLPFVGKAFKQEG